MSNCLTCGCQNLTFTLGMHVWIGFQTSSSHSPCSMPPPLYLSTEIILLIERSQYIALQIFPYLVDSPQKLPHGSVWQGKQSRSSRMKCLHTILVLRTRILFMQPPWICYLTTEPTLSSRASTTTPVIKRDSGTLYVYPLHEKRVVPSRCCMLRERTLGHTSVKFQVKHANHRRKT